MALIIGVVSQKGGVGKSTIARTIAAEYARHEWTVKIADLDTSQATSYHWHSRRLAQHLQPEIAVEQFARVQPALKLAVAYDLVVLDGAPHARDSTLEIARASDLVILPSGVSLDDLEPTVRLAHELKGANIPITKLIVVFCRVGDSQAELEEATTYIKAAGYPLLKGYLPERTGYRRASDVGKAATETAYHSLNQRADELVQGVVDRLKKGKK